MSWRNTLLRGIPWYLRWIRRWRTRIRAWLVWPLAASHSSTLEPTRGILERGIQKAVQSQYLDHYLFHQKLGFNFRWGIHFVISTYPLLWLSFVLFVLLCSCQIRKKMGTWGMPTSSVRNTTLDITQLDFYLAARYGCKTLLRILLKSFPWSCSAALVPHWNMAIKIARDWRRTNFFLIFSGPITI